MGDRTRSFVAVLSISLLSSLLAIGLAACGGESEAPSKPSKPAAKPAAKPSEPDLPQALVLSLASFAPFEKGKPPTALPARMEFLSFRDGKWTNR